MIGDLSPRTAMSSSDSWFESQGKGVPAKGSRLITVRLSILTVAMLEARVPRDRWQQFIRDAVAEKLAKTPDLPR